MSTTINSAAAVVEMWYQWRGGKGQENSEAGGWSFHRAVASLCSFQNSDNATCTRLGLLESNDSHSGLAYPWRRRFHILRHTLDESSLRAPGDSNTPLQQHAVSLRNADLDEDGGNLDCWQISEQQLQAYKTQYGQDISASRKLSRWLSPLRYVKLNENSSQNIECDETRKRRRKKLEALGETHSQ